MNSDPSVVLMLPDGEKVERTFELVPRVDDTIYFSDAAFRVSSVEHRMMEGESVFRPVLFLEELAR